MHRSSMAQTAPILKELAQYMCRYIYMAVMDKLWIIIAVGFLDPLLEEQGQAFTKKQGQDYLFS